MGTGSSGGNADDGNNITSPRPFADDIDELKNYIEKNIYGGEGGHYNKDQYNANYPNRQKMTKFEGTSKRRGKFYGQHDYYGNNTGGRSSISGLPGVWEQNFKKNNMKESFANTNLKQIDLKINGQEEEVYITSKTGLEDVTIKWGCSGVFGCENKYLVTFEYEDTIDDHGNEGMDTWFTAKSEDGKWNFGLEVYVEASFHDSGNIGDWDWNSLEIELDKSQKEPLNEQDADAKAYAAGLKRLQKAVIQFQLRYIQKQKSKAAAQAASATQEAGKGFDQQIKALQDQLKAIDKPPKKDQQKESLYKEYINERANDDLMVHIDTYRQTILLENTMKSLFGMFEKGKTNEEVLRHYAGEGVTMPEQFLIKARKQYENLKKQKLEIEFSEQEAKDIIFKPTIPQAQLFDIGDQEIEEKQLASGILKNNKK
jgi:hypothetical protein